MLGIAPPIRRLSSRAESRGFSLSRIFRGRGTQRGICFCRSVYSFSVLFCRMHPQLSASEGCNVARPSFVGARPFLGIAVLEPARMLVGRVFSHDKRRGREAQTIAPSLLQHAFALHASSGG